MSNSVRPHRWQPTRLPCPWDSPGKNTGVGCCFLLQYMKVKSESEVTSVVSNSVRPHRWQPTRLPCPWDSPGKNTGVGCHCLLRHFRLPAPYILYKTLFIFLHTSCFVMNCFLGILVFPQLCNKCPQIEGLKQHPF